METDDNVSKRSKTKRPRQPVPADEDKLITLAKKRGKVHPMMKPKKAFRVVKKVVPTKKIIVSKKSSSI